MYGLAAAPLTKADGQNIGAFRMKGFQHILEIKNPYWSRVSNKELLERANVKLNGEFDNKELRRLSTRLIEIQLEGKKRGPDID